MSTKDSSQENAMSDHSRKSPKDAEAEIWNAIAAFEKILEAIPNDRVSLETLADAYEKVGDHTRSLDYAIQLANVLLDESEEDDARELLSRLIAIAPDDSRIKETSERLKAHTPDKVMADVLEDDEDMSGRSMNIAAEISFAWNLLQANKLTQEEYSKVIHDLSENSARAANTSVSTLHVLNDMHFTNINAVIDFVSVSCKTPFISLANFEITQTSAELLPSAFAIKRGALLFDLMGNDALIAILNPYDDQLPMDVEELTGKLCHFFLVAPDDFDKALAKIIQAESAMET